MVSTSPFFFSAILAVVTSAVATPLATRAVWAPPITFPTAGSSFHPGSSFDVTWNTANPPAQITPGNEIILRSNFGAEDQIPFVTLADNVDLLQGAVEVTLPSDLACSDDYIVVLIGESDDGSPSSPCANRAPVVSSTFHVF